MSQVVKLGAEAICPRGFRGWFLEYSSFYAGERISIGTLNEIHVAIIFG